MACLTPNQTGIRAGVRPRRKPRTACNLLYMVLYISLQTARSLIAAFGLKAAYDRGFALLTRQPVKQAQGIGARR